MRNVKSLVVAGLVLGGSAGAANAAVTTFTNQSDWLAARGGANVLTETFDGAASSFPANSIDNPAGLVTVDMIGGFGNVGSTGLTGTGFLQGKVDSSPIGTDGLSLKLNRTGLLGFALFNLRSGPDSSDGLLDLQEIGFAVAGESFLLSDILGLSDPSDPGEVPEFNSAAPVPFVGFIVDSAIDSFILQHGDLVRPVAGGRESFLLDGLALAHAKDPGGGSDVPAPAMLMLLGMGLVGLGIARRRFA